MRLKKLALAVAMSSAAALVIVGCNDSKDRRTNEVTDIEVFDGYAENCNVSANGITADEVGGGLYRIETSSELPDGAVVSATDCEDVDTGALLPPLIGAAQSGGVAVSPFTTLIVTLALAEGGDPANISQATLEQARNTIVDKLNLGNYDPLNPATANYVKTIASTNTAQAEASKSTMQLGLAVATLLKTIEREAGSEQTPTAVSNLVRVIANPTTPVITFSNPGAVQDLLTRATNAVVTENPALANTFTSVNNAAATIIESIASASDVTYAAGIAKETATILNSQSSSITEISTINPETVQPITVGNPGTGDSGGTVPPPTGSTGSTGGTGGSGG